MKRWRSLERAMVPAWALILAACGEPQTGDAVSIEAFGVVGAHLILDVNGTGSADAGDSPLAGWTVNLDQPAGGTVVSAVTDEQGLATFSEVPVGRLVAAVPASALGDTLTLLPTTAQPFVLEASRSVELAPVVALPSFTVGQVRELPAGKPLFTEGIALNAFATGDRSLHIKAGGRYLRVLSVDEGTVAVGDSVRVSGRTVQDQGVPVLDGKVVFRLRASTGLPVPVQLSTDEAAGARGGMLDAALVAVSGADILEVVDEGDAGVLLVVNDGTGPLRLRFRSFLAVNPKAIDPVRDHLAAAVGLLVPVSAGGGVVWEIRPRATAEVAFYRVTE